MSGEYLSLDMQRQRAIKEYVNMMEEKGRNPEKAAELEALIKNKIAEINALAYAINKERNKTRKSPSRKTRKSPSRKTRKSPSRKTRKSPSRKTRKSPKKSAKHYTTKARKQTY